MKYKTLLYIVVCLLVYNIVCASEYEEEIILFYDDSISTLFIIFDKSEFEIAKSKLEEGYGMANIHSIDTYVNKKGELYTGNVYRWHHPIFEIVLLEHFYVGGKSAIIHMYKKDKR